MNDMRVLHCLDGLGFGGIETWLLNLLRIKPGNVHFDFLVRNTGRPYEDEVRHLGGKIYSCPPRGKIRKAAELAGFDSGSKTLKEVLRQENYDVIHAHGHRLLGQVMKEAALRGISKRIAHSHSANYLAPATSCVAALKKVYHVHIDRKNILKYATDIIACSREAGLSLIGDPWETDPRCRTLYCGIPTERFRLASRADRVSVRESLNIPENAVVIGHVGNANRAKNQPMVMRVFNELAKRDKKYHLLMIGLGGEIPEVRRLIDTFDLGTRVSLPGVRDDVPAAMLHAMDVFLLPSLYEGLPVTALEAVCAGLYVVCSDRITTEFTGHFKDRVEPVSLDQSPAFWADRVEAGIPNRISCVSGLAMLAKSPFSIEASLDALLALYRVETGK